MLANRKHFRDLRWPLTIALCTVIALFFWLGSRYPALNEKALMGDKTPMAGLAFDFLFEAFPDSSFATEVIVNIVNWAYTNWKGMTFGLLFGAAALTAFTLIQNRSAGGRFANAAMGGLIGAPLGVCVNCATPIAHGLYLGGARLETALAALVASPTLNVIVVSMAFTLLPLHLAIMKLVLMLLFILVGVPLLCSIAARMGIAEPVRDAVCEIPAAPKRKWMINRLIDQLRPSPADVRSSFDLMSAVNWVLVSFLRNLAFIVVVTVPVMVLAGALGAIVVTVVPFDSILNAIGGIGFGIAGTLVALTLIAVITLFLPAPMAFDIILVSTLIAGGWPDHYAMVVLLALGSFSVYPFWLLGQTISYRIACAMAGSLTALAVFGAVITKLIGPYFAAYSSSQVDRIIAAAAPMAVPEIARPAPTISAAELARLQSGQRVEYRPLGAAIDHSGRGKVSAAINIFDTGPKPLPTTLPFARLTGAKIGITDRRPVSPIRFFEPYAYFDAIAGGDIDGDGWDDLAVGSDPTVGGLSLYANVGGRFFRREINLGPLEKSFVNAIAFVDLNADGARDLFVATFLDGAHIFWNQDGAFDAARRTTLENGDALMLAAPAFADLDGDGRTDIVAGNWVGGTLINFGHDERARNRIFWNEPSGFTATELDGLPGETLSVLVTELNDDGRPDILIGDDSFGADKIYLNSGDRTFRIVRDEDALVPWMTQTTMSLDSGDFDNDGRLDVYVAQIAMPEGGEDTMSYCNPEMVKLHNEGDRCNWRLRNRSQAFFSSNRKLSNCTLIVDPEARVLCAVRVAIKRSTLYGDPDGCDALPEGWNSAKRLCKAIADGRDEIGNQNQLHQTSIPTLVGRNVLLNGADGAFEDASPKVGAARPGWSWNARFVDLDQDGWRDLFVATGYIPNRDFQPNAYFRNVDGKAFVHASADLGLADAIPTAAYVTMDYDRDGDIDLIRAPSVSGAIVHRNDAAMGGAIWVGLQDKYGPSHGLGATVILEIDNAPSQMHEIKASGGFASAEPQKVHFGLGVAASASAMKILWPDGAETQIQGPIPSNSEVIVTRQSTGSN